MLSSYISLWFEFKSTCKLLLLKNFQHYLKVLLYNRQFNTKFKDDILQQHESAQSTSFETVYMYISYKYQWFPKHIEQLHVTASSLYFIILQTLEFHWLFQCGTIHFLYTKHVFCTSNSAILGILVY